MAWGLFTEDDGRVVRIVNLDRVEPSSPPDLQVDTLPDEPETGRAERAVLYVVDGAAVWQVEPRPLSEEERLADVEVKVGAVPPWEPYLTYVLDEHRTYQGSIYRCATAHTAHDPNWTPPNTPALWVRIGSAPPDLPGMVDQLRGLRSQVEAANNAAQLRAALLNVLDVLTGDL